MSFKQVENVIFFFVLLMWIVELRKEGEAAEYHDVVSSSAVQPHFISASLDPSSSFSSAFSSSSSSSSSVEDGAKSSPMQTQPGEVNYLSESRVEHHDIISDARLKSHAEEKHETTASKESEEDESSEEMDIQRPVILGTNVKFTLSVEDERFTNKSNADHDNDDVVDGEEDEENSKQLPKHQQWRILHQNETSRSPQESINTNIARRIQTSTSLSITQVETVIRNITRSTQETKDPLTSKLTTVTIQETTPNTATTTVPTSTTITTSSQIITKLSSSSSSTSSPMTTKSQEKEALSTVSTSNSSQPSIMSSSSFSSSSSSLSLSSPSSSFSSHSISTVQTSVNTQPSSFIQRPTIRSRLARPKSIPIVASTAKSIQLPWPSSSPSSLLQTPSTTPLATLVETVAPPVISQLFDNSLDYLQSDSKPDIDTLFATDGEIPHRSQPIMSAATTNTIIISGIMGGCAILFFALLTLFYIYRQRTMRRRRKRVPEITLQKPTYDNWHFGSEMYENEYY